MSSILPTPSNGYLISLDTALDPPNLNSIFSSLHTRIGELEEQIVDWEAAVDNLNNLGLQVIAENLEPQLQASRDQLAALQTQADELADQIASLIAAGIFASGVTVTPIVGLTATTAQAAIAELLTKITTTSNALTAAINGKADATALAALKAGAATIVTASVTAVAGDRIFVKTAGGALTVTLPPAPADGNCVTLWRYGASTLVVARNGMTIAGVADNLNINSDKVEVTLIYLDGDWRVFARPFA